MAMKTVNGIEELQGLIGETVGPSDWREVTQDDVNRFAELSGDDQWIHVDVERAKEESPFGTTIAHGNLTLSLIDGFRDALVGAAPAGTKLGVNLGYARVRFPAPVPVGSPCLPTTGTAARCPTPSSRCTTRAARLTCGCCATPPSSG